MDDAATLGPSDSAEEETGDAERPEGQGRAGGTAGGVGGTGGVAIDALDDIRGDASDDTSKDGGATRDALEDGAPDSAAGATDAAPTDAAVTDVVTMDAPVDATATDVVADSAPEAVGGGEGGKDAGATTCDPTSTAFGVPILVPGLNRILGGEEAVQLSQDELTAYISAGTPDLETYEIYQATRARRTDPFGAYTLVPELNSSGADIALSISGDGLTVFFDSDRGIGTFRIFVATRQAIGEPFSTPHPFVTALDFDTPFAPYLLPAGNVLYFNRELNGIYRQPVRAQVADGPPTLVSSTGSEWLQAAYPVVSADEHVIYFESPNPRGDPDIWIASRNDVLGPFGTPVNLASVNTGGSDFPAWISPDGCRLYIIRYPAPSSIAVGLFLYVAERPSR